MPAGFSDDRRMIRSYGVAVRLNLDAATAYKVAKAYDRTLRKRCSLKLLVHLQPMRICSAHFIRRYLEVQTKPVPGHLLVLRRIAFLTESTGVAWIQAFSGHRELCPKTVFT